jgi:NADH:ubiquinone oxidoreductase subunit 6 (subunit J)
MDALAGIEKIVALVGAIVVAVFAIIALRGEWKKTGLDDQVTKLLLGLMAFGCILVLLAATGVLPHASGGAA